MKDNDPKLFVYWLEAPVQYMFGQKDNRSITMWAKTPEEGLAKLSDWADKGYKLKFLYSMDDFIEGRERQIAEEIAWEKHAKETAPQVEVENV